MIEGNPYSHFYLYAKGWYQKNDDRFEDLLKILAEYTGSSIEFLSYNDLSTVLLEIVEREIMVEKSFRLTDFAFRCESLGLISACLIVMECAPTGKKGRLPMYKPSAKILPLDKKSFGCINILDWAD